VQRLTKHLQASKYGFDSTIIHFVFWHETCLMSMKTLEL